MRSTSSRASEATEGPSHPVFDDPMGRSLASLGMRSYHVMSYHLRSYTWGATSEELHLRSYT